jgi:16S rRNA (cytidine1402-2'-O)-methyltransferase
VSPPGRLVLVAMPIGNLGDLSPRAAGALAAADVICAEDTRLVRKVLTHAAVSLSGKELLAVHAHNEDAVAPRLVRRVQGGAIVALTSDAGTPGISDPGGRVVSAVLAAGLPVETVPGPSALLAALVLSGLPADRFCFEGFLPRKGGPRAARLAAIAADPRTTVLFESPRRVARTVADLRAVCGPDRLVALARELTKRHEEVWRGTLEEAEAWLAAGEPRGEFVIVVGGAGPGHDAPRREAVSAADLEARLVARLAAGETRKDAVAGVAAELGIAKRTVYQAAVALPRPAPGQESGPPPAP